MDRLRWRLPYREQLKSLEHLREHYCRYAGRIAHAMNMSIYVHSAFWRYTGHKIFRRIYKALSYKESDQAIRTRFIVNADLIVRVFIGSDLDVAHIRLASANGILDNEVNIT
jgi:hypothetical protein